MLRRRSSLAMAVCGFTAGLVLPAAVLANTGFTATADRLSVNQGVATAVVVTITPDDQDDVDNRCYAIQIPAAFVIQGAPQITARPNSSNWSADLQSGRVRLRSNGDSQIEGDERLSAAITVRGVTPGSHTWTVGGYDNNGCGDGDDGADEQRSISMSIAPVAPTPQPTPQPTPAATPRPPSATPRPTSAPANPGQPGAPPSIPTSTPSLDSGGDSGAPRPSSSPAPGDTSPADPATGGPPGPLPPGRVQGIGPLDSDDTLAAAITPAAPGGEPALTVPMADGRPGDAGVQTQISSSVYSAMAMLDNAFEWFVPGLTVGVPGMLILMVLGAQVLGGFVWLPAIRRTLREERRRRRPLRPAWL